MAGGHAKDLFRLIRNIVGPDQGGDASDGQLLRRFADRRDEAAFAALVGRHGPLVLGVCCRLLTDPNDAEDAFQATFAVLARKACAVARPHRLANWLYGVARRTALEAKVRAARRRARERQAADRTDAAAGPEAAADRADLRAVLDEEVDRLPERYRVPFVLCHLEGRTDAEAARLLGCPEGTVFSRLAWARQRLRSRLARRGLAPSAGPFAALAGQAVSPTVPAALAGRTVAAALSFAGGSSSGPVAAGIASLAEGVLSHMFRRKVQFAAGLLLALSLAGGAGVLAWSPHGHGRASPQAVGVQGEVAQALARLPPEQERAAQADRKEEPGGPAEASPAALIKAATTRPGPGEDYPARPSLSTEMRGQVGNEILGSRTVRGAYAKLDARERNVTWFEGVAELEKEKAVWCLASCLCHPSPDVQIHALRSLERLGDRRAVPFLVLYAEYMAVEIGGSENATIHGVIHQDTAKTLSALTGVRVMLTGGQDAAGLRRGIRLWRKWLCDNP
jgi:RNA polymerase sigma factor (sigma-70 family)